MFNGGVLGVCLCDWKFSHTEMLMANNSEPFYQMKEKIDRNEGTKFGGAAVIVPPTGAGDAIELLLLDAQGDQAQFWSTILTRIQVIMQNLQEKERVASTFGRR